MFGYLHISDRRERAAVGTADAALRLAAPLVRALRRPPCQPPRRILLLRLERIGDLLMVLEAIEDVRQAAPAAAIDLVVGSWNADLARRIRGVRRVEVLDAAWLVRGGRGMPVPGLLRQAFAWRREAYDLALNFEPDIRSNLLLAASGAARTAGFATGGGGPLLDVALAYDPARHTATNARRLAAAVLDVPERRAPARLELSDGDRRAGAACLAGRPGPFVGLHAAGGRLVKQWPPERFAELAARIAGTHGATIVLTGSRADRELVADVAKGLAPHAIDLSGAIDVPRLGALLEQLDVFVTGDTGPMHLAAAVGTPVVAIFGPSDPVRYAPADPMHHVVRVQLPCSPCNRIRRPPERCTGHIPDCLTAIDVTTVQRAVERVLGERQRRQLRNDASSAVSAPAGAARR